MNTSTPTLDAPEMRAAGQRFATTPTGIQIGSRHVRRPSARTAGSVSGPHRRRHPVRRAVLWAAGSSSALWLCIGLGAAALLWSAR